jgi:hypothetical protein
MQKNQAESQQGFILTLTTAPVARAASDGMCELARGWQELIPEEA